MSTKTEILKLTKPAATDIVDISVINENMDIIDENFVAKEELNKIKKNLDDSDAALKSGYESADESIRTDLHTATESLKSGYESADESIRTDLHTATERIENDTKEMINNKGIELDKKISSLRLYRDDEGYLCEMEE
jgi:hypothetical protein